jgi:Fe-S-cluster containining protein
VTTSLAPLEFCIVADPRTDLARLCQSCALCCDGSLFGRVVLQPGEVKTARRNRLRVLRSGKGFEQRCATLETAGAGGQCRCAIYAERPLACRQFTCRLYERHRAEGGPIEPRLAAVTRVRELVASLEAAGLTPPDFEGDGSNGPAEAMFAELMQRLGDDFARADR